MIGSLARLNLGQQIGLACGILCLLTSLSLVLLASVSSAHMQREEQLQLGTALAGQIARRITTSLESGDLLSVAASLQRFVETSSAVRVALFDLDGQAMGQAGSTAGLAVTEYRAPVRIDNDIAGEVVIALSTEASEVARQQFILSLLGLTLLLSLGVYAIARALGQATGNQLRVLAHRIDLQPELKNDQSGNNEVGLLRQHIEALPIELLRARQSGAVRDEHYQQVSILYVQLDSLARYVDALDENALQRYTRRLHQVLVGAAGFYQGHIEVAREFGIAIYFSGSSNSGSAPFRAASCGWLVRELCRELDKQQRLSMTVSLAVAASATGPGDEEDIYPGLYIQHVLDELKNLCSAGETQDMGVILDAEIVGDKDVSSRIEVAWSEDRGLAELKGFIEPYNDLLERQLRLVWKRLTTT